MTDYAKWKVTDLKAELKRRGIPQTGLRVKQQFIDRLVEEDAQQGNDAVANGEPPVEQDAAPEATQPVELEPVPEPEPEPTADAPAKPGDLEPEVKEDKAEEPVQEQTQEQEQSDAVNETKPEPVAEVPNEKAAEQEQQVQQDHLDEPAQESPKQEEPAEPTDATMTDQPTDTTMVEPVDTSIPQDQTKTETAAAPVEQAPGEAAEQPAMVEPKGAEPPASDETAPPVAVPSEMNTAFSTPLPTEEVLEDRRKRKRRSQSPVPTPEALASKKAKAQDETPRVLLSEDQDAMDREREARQDGRGDSGPPGTPEEEERAGPETAPEHDAPPVQDETSKKGAPLKHDVRFKGLFAAKETEQTRPVSPPPDAVMEDADVEPALHVATAALYVGGLMRPLQPVALRNHLVSLASPPDASPHPDVVVDFYLDPIKTHCLVSFTTVAAASRARTALHGTVWPNERNRKTLFVDFIPEDKLPQWIEKEEGSRQRGGPPPRWEVRYEPTDDGVEAVLGEIDARSAASQPARGPEPSGFSRPPPTGPRAELGAPGRRPSGEAPVDSSSRPGQGFKPLDELFMSTTTKPKLYYLPVPREVADRRLDRFDDLLRKGDYPRRGGDEPRRITFEDDDLFVDNGPDFGGGNGRSRRGRGRGGRGRGGFGDSWRDDRRGRY
ncbi:SAP domain protein [Aspergillus sclerotiicarbonarius CBS 121057]|uniref:SAP domain protein n=1 Tax=Aspergillus sclerotiicarbonarius (strain CBS 121057 / IBT 28362) TaxID=1448318 RepID=A0A319EKS8_ASPSB|nr:SAP domain protein [Aspergillus sclerotiicarbonarius CBS 121057]